MHIRTYTSWERTASRCAGCEAGQAIVEFVVALVAAIVLVAGLLQIGRLARLQTEAALTSRLDAGGQAINGEWVPPILFPNYIQDRLPGPDERPYSKDDQWYGADLDRVPTEIVAHAKPRDLDAHARGNAISRLQDWSQVLDSFELVPARGSGMDHPLPVIRHLVYDAGVIEVESTTWMALTYGIY